MTDKRTKTDLIRHVSLAARMPEAQARAAVDAVLGFITDEVKGGRDVMLSGFGNFVLRERAQRTGRNPRTGLAVEIPASAALVFRASKKAIQ